MLQFGQPRRVIREPGLWVKRPFVENVIYLRQARARFRAAAGRGHRLRPEAARRRHLHPLPHRRPAAVLSDGRHRGRRARPAERDGQRQPAPGARQRHAVRHLLSDKRAGDHAADPRRGRRRRPRPSASTSSMCGCAAPICRRRTARRSMPACSPSASSRRAQYRGEGAEAAQTVRANAERERTVILAEAQRDAQRVRGDGDAAGDQDLCRRVRPGQGILRLLPLAAGLSRRAQRPDDLLRADARTATSSASSSGSAGATGAPAAPPAHGGRLAAGGTQSPRSAAVDRRRARVRGRLMRDLGTALALVLVIEGILYALFPEGMKRAGGARAAGAAADACGWPAWWPPASGSCSSGCCGAEAGARDHRSSLACARASPVIFAPVESGAR